MKRNLTKTMTRIRGDLTGITGDLIGITGNLTSVTGDLNDCDISYEERKKGIDINDLVLLS